MKRARMAAGLALVAAGCAASSGPPPGMVIRPPRDHAATPGLTELASVEPARDRRALLVVFPRSACSGSASTVLVDTDGRFLGAIPPGTAALVSIPVDTASIIAVSSVEVFAPVGASYFSEHVRVPPLPDGLLVQSSRFNARECGNGQYADVSTATKSALEEALADAELQWLESRPDAGQAWLDAHRPRVAELLSGPAASPSPWVNNLPWCTASR